MCVSENVGDLVGNSPRQFLGEWEIEECPITLVGLKDTVVYNEARERCLVDPNLLQTANIVGCKFSGRFRETPHFWWPHHTKVEFSENPRNTS